MDDRVREAERRWRLTGSVTDEAAWLRERARVGELGPTRLSLARHCGHDALGGPEEPLLPFGEWLARMPVDDSTPLAARSWRARPLVAVGRAFMPVAEALGCEPFGHAVLELERQLVRRTGERACGLLLRDRMREAHHSRHELAMSWFVEAAWQALRDDDFVLDPAQAHAAAQRSLEPEALWSVEPDPRIDAVIEARFPRAEGRLWGLRLRVRDQLVAWALGS